jgi:hypothetical protein
MVIDSPLYRNFFLSRLFINFFQSAAVNSALYISEQYFTALPANGLLCYTANAKENP